MLTRSEDIEPMSPVTLASSQRANTAMTGNTVKVIVDINENIANVVSITAPPGITVDVETRDYDTDNYSVAYLEANAKLDDSMVPYLPGGEIHEATGAMLMPLAAILARINGEFDHPALLAYGPLLADTLADVARIAQQALEGK